MDSSEIQLKPRKFEDLCSLEYSFATCPTPSWPQFKEWECIVVQFSGECGKGTCNQGFGFAYFISAIANAAITAWQPAALIMDLSRLKYEWGDEMSEAFRIELGLETRPLIFMAAFETHPKPIESDWEKLAKAPKFLPWTVVTSELNSAGLESLFRQEMCMDPKAYLFGNLQDALAAVDEQLQKHFKKEI